MKFQVGDKEIELFQIRQVAKVLGVTNEAIRKKEERNQVPKAIFHNDAGSRLYSPEEIAMFDYLFKSLWKRRQGVKLPDEFVQAAHKAFNIVRREVLENGRVDTPDILDPVQAIWNGFVPGVAYTHILHWRAILLGEEEEVDVGEFNLDQFLNNY